MRLHALWLVLTLAATAGIVDRISVTVGNRVISSSDIETRLRLSAMQNGKAADLSLAARRAAAQQLIDQRLVAREMELGHYPRLEPAERARLLPALAATSFKASMEALDGALASAHLHRQDLEEDLARQSELLTFLSLRFRPAVQVSDADVERYYRERIIVKVPLNDIRDSIEQSVASERADQELENWLADQRKRTRIVFVDRELQ